MQFWANIGFSTSTISPDKCPTREKYDLRFVTTRLRTHQALTWGGPCKVTAENFEIIDNPVVSTFKFPCCLDVALIVPYSRISHRVHDSHDLGATGRLTIGFHRVDVVLRHRIMDTDVEELDEQVTQPLTPCTAASPSQHDQDSTLWGLHILLCQLPLQLRFEQKSILFNCVS